VEETQRPCWFKEARSQEPDVPLIQPLVDELTRSFQREPLAWQYWIGHDSEDARRRQRSYLGSITCNPLTREKCRLLNVATWLPRSRAVAATIRS
jgi:hypothetical protein